MINLKIMVMALCVLALLLGCEDDYPDPIVASIYGQVVYGGTAIRELESPVLIVVAYAYQADVFQRLQSGEQITSHASFFVAEPVFDDGGTSYRLDNIEPFEKGYFVVAVIADYTDPTVGAVASGTYPDNNLMFETPTMGPLNPGPGESIHHVDIDMMDIPR